VDARFVTHSIVVSNESFIAIREPALLGSGKISINRARARGQNIYRGLLALAENAVAASVSRLPD